MEEKNPRIDNTKEGEGEDMVIDRISDLPDPILGHILSYLPTENAVATSILSKRWKLAWSAVHNLDLWYIAEYQGVNKSMDFVEFVDRVLLLHDGGSINKFNLSWSPYSSSLSHLGSWINFAITRNVKWLCLDFGRADDEKCIIPISSFNCDTLRSLLLIEIGLVCDATAVVCLPKLERFHLYSGYFVSMKACERLVRKLIKGCPTLQDLYLSTRRIDDSKFPIYFSGMPLCVFSCEPLRSLALKNYLSVPAAIVVCCTRLERLKLCHVSFESEEACENLISGFPMLQYLKLSITNAYDGHDDNDIFSCIISSASLRRLEIYFHRKCSLKLKASSLESFVVRGKVSAISVEESLRSMVQAEFGIELVEHGSVNNSDNSIVEVVRAFDCAKSLTLSPSIMLALSHATVSLLTDFKRLVQLVAGLCCSSLQDFIQNSNNLQEIIIHKGAFNCDEHPKWTTPIEVPRCLSNSLKSVHFSSYDGSEGERDMILLDNLLLLLHAM